MSMTTTYKSSKRESPFQTKVIGAGKARGWLIVKVVSESVNGWPDLYCLKNGRTILLEAKRPDGQGELSPNQIKRHKEIRAHGGEVYVVEDLQHVINIFDNA